MAIHPGKALVTQSCPQCNSCTSAVLQNIERLTFQFILRSKIFRFKLKYLC